MRRNRQSLFALILLAVFVLAGIGYVVVPFLNDRKTSTEATSEGSAGAGSSTPTFTKEGEVVFISGGAAIKKIDVEVAENEAERNQGLMYRSYMPDSVGMLFIFEQSEPQSFWMKNTIIPLDILYVNENKEIVYIHKNTTPYSEQSLPSYENAQYVVEVNAGFTDRYGIKVGDSISF
ncbi:DUF192 domain-containing protein [Telluribacter sp. SYSU D00476]|uniref:DUF192 domain-containing protein n=1 Tax=Telluribacter sp. SYSU D00476 TaxID=2811430 RepID=UPI001FF5E027|nr:DUF192 domain-containing protein [Telluribacter sp. SYSU D00476]